MFQLDRNVFEAFSKETFVEAHLKRQTDIRRIDTLSTAN